MKYPDTGINPSVGIFIYIGVEMENFVKNLLSLYGIMQENSIFARQIAINGF